MKKTTTLIMTTFLVLGLTGCSSTDESSDVTNPISETEPSDDVTTPILRVVSTPNPNLFPLLLAMASDDSLEVKIVPVSGGAGINSAFESGDGDALVSMTFVAAKKSNDSAIEPMHLHSVNFWSGFHTLSYAEDNITSMDDMVGKNYMISGPVGSGENGGPDIFFKAAMRAIGKSEGAFNMYYKPLMEGQSIFSEGTTLDDGERVSGYHMVEPAATGITMNNLMNGSSVARSVNMQSLFNDMQSYTSWDNTELPLGGLSVARRVDNNSSYDTIVSKVVTAYNNAARDLMDADRIQLREYAQTISSGIEQYYGEYNISIPAPVVIAAIGNGQLVYKSDVDMDAIESDLDSFLEFVIEDTVAEEFYR